MYKKLNNRRISGETLEHIMRDVLYGMQDFTAETSKTSQPCQLDVLSVEKDINKNLQTAKVIPFRRQKYG